MNLSIMVRRDRRSRRDGLRRHPGHTSRGRVSGRIRDRSWRPRIRAGSRQTGLGGAGAFHGRILFPPAALGVIGSGQLGRMFIQSAQRMGYRAGVLSATEDAPAAQVAPCAAAPSLGPLRGAAVAGPPPHARRGGFVTLQTLPEISAVRLQPGSASLAGALDRSAARQP